MRRTLLLLAVLLPAFAESPSERIGLIDFYGYGTLDITALRAALPFHEGDRVPSDKAREAATQTLAKVAGREAAIGGACCQADGRSLIYVGLAEPGVPPAHYNPRPQQDLKLPADALQIFKQLETHFEAAVNKGNAQEDDSQGYALISDATARADQLKVRDWTRANTPLVLHVLADSRRAPQRAYAAEALGYAERSPQQIAALVEAAFDEDETVRNNAIRALGVLCNVGAEVTRQIPAERFLPLLHSLTWTDRNKGSLLFLKMTESRDPGILKLLQEQASTALREMARWKDPGHAYAAKTILERIAGTAGKP